MSAAHPFKAETSRAASGVLTAIGITWTATRSHQTESVRVTHHFLTGRAEA